MTTRLTILNGTDWSDGQVLYGADLSDTTRALDGPLGEVRMFSLSTSGAITKANLQTRGWAICDGTTPSAQGITSATLIATPDMQDRFVFMSNDASSGTTGTTSHTHLQEDASRINATSVTSIGNWIEEVFFIKVKI